MFLEKLLKIALKNAVRVVCYVFEGEKLRAASNPSFPHVSATKFDGWARKS